MIFNPTLRWITLAAMSVICLLGTLIVGGSRVSANSTNVGLNGTTWQMNLNVTHAPSVTPLLGYKLDTNENERFLATDVTDYVCTASKLCSGNRTDRYPRCTVECTGCQCDDICHYYGDCCPDLLFQYSAHTPSVPSPYLACIQGSWTTWGNDSDIFIVSRCPEQHQDKDTVSKCEIPDKYYRDQATPVSATDSQVTYRNIYCAKCHGLTDTKPWTHQVKCEPDASLNKATTKDELWKLVLKSSACKVTSFPPSGVLTRSCFPESTGKCNVTGKWKERIPMVERLCGLFTHRIDYYGSSPFFHPYKNIFCALCNGVIFNEDMDCQRVLSDGIPFPLSVLLDFNSETEIKTDNKCESEQVLDPFSGLCQYLKCSARRVLADGDCEFAFSSTEGLGFRLSLLLHPDNSTWGLQEDIFFAQYKQRMRNILESFKPFIFTFLFVELLDDYVNRDNAYKEIAMMSVTIELVTMADRTLRDMEQALDEILNLKLIYSDGDVNMSISSTPLPCSWGNDWKKNYSPFGIMFYREPPTLLDGDCSKFDCLEHVKSPPPEQVLDCAFVEYNLTMANFTYDPMSASLEYHNHTIYLNAPRLLYCGETLKICSDVVLYIQNVLTGRLEQPKKIHTGTANDTTMALVSLVCISLSLVGLFVTFVIYCSVSQLQTAPGKNTMALVFHLFHAHLFFIVGTSWTDDVVLCRAVGVLIHYFWLTSFAWMALSAYHMQKVFTSMLVTRDALSESKRVVRYVLVCNLSPVMVILSCIIYHLATSEGSEIGYGGDICFLKGPYILIIFFIAPLCLMLIYNIFCFVRTVMAIRSVPDMKTVSNKANRHYVFTYIKLSLLFGFTWVFGIIAAIFQSDVLWYVFIVLTGSQGVLIFIAYIVNLRTWKMLKAKYQQKQSNSNRYSGGGSEVTIATTM